MMGDEAATPPSGRMLLLRTNAASEPKGQAQRGRDQRQAVQHGEQLPHRAMRGRNGALLRGQERTRQSGDDEKVVSGRMLWRRQGPRHRRRRLAGTENVALPLTLGRGNRKGGRIGDT